MDDRRRQPQPADSPGGHQQDRADRTTLIVEGYLAKDGTNKAVGGTSSSPMVRACSSAARRRASRSSRVRLQPDNREGREDREGREEQPFSRPLFFSSLIRMIDFGINDPREMPLHFFFGVVHMDYRSASAHRQAELLDLPALLPWTRRLCASAARREFTFTAQEQRPVEEYGSGLTRFRNTVDLPARRPPRESYGRNTTGISRRCSSAAISKAGSGWRRSSIGLRVR